MDKLTSKYQEEGTKLAGYANRGPYSCGQCTHESGGYCNHPIVVLDSEIKNERRGQSVKIDEEHGCCTYVRAKDTPTESHPMMKVLK